MRTYSINYEASSYGLVANDAHDLIAATPQVAAALKNMGWTIESSSGGDITASINFSDMVLDIEIDYSNNNKFLVKSELATRTHGPRAIDAFSASLEGLAVATEEYIGRLDTRA